MPDGSFVIAIDGPSAAGKTTVGMSVARRLSATFLDTGVLYRVITLLALERGIGINDVVGLTGIADHLDVQVQQAHHDNGHPSDISVAGRDVTSLIRSPEVDAAVSHVASYPEVREAIQPLQRGAATASRLVVVGRDIGTVIFPDAELKIYLDASPGERARRRARDMEANHSATAIREAIEQRDALDRERAVAPLVAAPDAVVIDTDYLTVAQV